MKKEQLNLHERSNINGRETVVPEDEARLGGNLKTIRALIKKFNEIKSEEEKEEFKILYPNFNEIIAIVDEIDKNNIKTKEDSRYYRNALQIKEWMTKRKTEIPPKVTGKREEYLLAIKLSAIRTELVNPYKELENEEEKEAFKQEHPELDDVMEFIEWIDENKIPTNLKHMLNIKKWMIDNNKKRPPRCQNNAKSIPWDEGRLGDNFTAIKRYLINPYNKLESKEQREKFKEEHPEIEEVIEIANWINENTEKLKEDSNYYWNALKIKEWMEKNNTTKPPRYKSNNDEISEEEITLGNNLRSIRYGLIKPYMELENEEEKEAFKQEHPEVEEVMDIVNEIDKNNVKQKDDSAFYWNALKIKQWMEKNNTTKPPRSQYKSRKTGENSVPVEEARLGDRLSDIRMNLISPYSRLETEKEKKSYKMEHPELEEVLQIIEWIDNRIPEKLQQARDIKIWMKNNNTTNPPRATIKRNSKALRLEDMDDIEKEEYMLGTALRRIRTKLIEPYNKLATNEEKEEYKRNNPELEEVMAIVEEIDRNNRKVKKNGLKQIVVEQKQNGLLGENIEVESKFDETFEKIEHNLSNEQEI